MDWKISTLNRLWKHVLMGNAFTDKSILERFSEIILDHISVYYMFSVKAPERCCGYLSIVNI